MLCRSSLWGWRWQRPQTMAGVRTLVMWSSALRPAGWESLTGTRCWQLWGSPCPCGTLCAGSSHLRTYLTRFEYNTHFFKFLWTLPLFVAIFTLHKLYVSVTETLSPWVVYIINELSHLSLSLFCLHSLTSKGNWSEIRLSSSERTRVCGCIYCCLKSRDQMFYFQIWKGARPWQMHSLCMVRALVEADCKCLENELLDERWTCFSFRKSTHLSFPISHWLYLLNWIGSRIEMG